MESTTLYEQMLQGHPLASSTEEIIFEDNFANEIYMKYVDESTGIDLFAEMERDEKAYLDDLQSITNKIDLPIDEFVASIENPDDVIEDTLNLANMKNEQLLMEFNSILDAVELQNQMTPPQTPPYVPGLPEAPQHHIPSQPDDYQIFNAYQPPVLAQPSSDEQFVYIQSEISAAPAVENDITVYFESSNQSMISADEISCQEIIFDPESIISSPTDIQRELEVVDELIRSHSRQNCDSDASSSSAWSPRSEYSTSSSNSSHYDFEPSKKSSSGLRGVTKKRSRGYGRNPEEKKSRKKEQNKNAATRYRMKKKQEVEIILDEERLLMDKNRKLSTTYKDTKREVKYLKSLLRDLFKARGFI